jgi:hypothetical protein
MAEIMKLDLPSENKLATQVAFVDYITESVWSPGRNIETESVSGAKQQNYYLN